VTVDDEGVGLPSDHRRVFEAFVQGESVDRRVHDEGGVGVGLFIAKSLLKQMGGRVDAKRREHGSRFVVTLRPAGAARQLSSPSVARP
jgi:signal transduction histidine kinase